MRNWKTPTFKDAPVGAISLIPICLTLVCFQVVGFMVDRGIRISATLLIVCGFTFTPAITCCFYSIAREKSKVFGTAGLAIAAATIFAQRETLYFVEMGLLLVPCTLVVMMVIAKRRSTLGWPER